jgi:hypothetical protein
MELVASAFRRKKLRQREALIVRLAYWLFRVDLAEVWSI